MKYIYISFLLFNVATVYGQTDEVIQNIENYLSELSQDEYFGVSISIAKNDKIVLNQAFGYADRAHKIPNTIETSFNIASIGKMFTAVSILQLKDHGKIDLHLPIANYLPDFPNQYIKDSVTIHQLLTHSSGLPLWFSPEFDTNPKFDYIELSDYLPLYENITINRSKIGQNSYSNVGYIVLGYVIEQVSGLSYKSYLNQYIFKPLDLNATNLWRLTEIIPNAAIGYVRPNGKNDWWKTNFHLNKGSSPAGGAYASSSDLVKFFIGLKNHKILSKAMTDLMFSPKIKTYYGEYGYAMGINAKNGKKIFGHLGGYYGIRGELMWYESSDYIVAILANSDQTDYADVSYFIQTQLTGTTAQKTAFQHTTQLLQSKTIEKIVAKEKIIKGWKNKKFDESLIQIKGYYYLNNQMYEKAKFYFKLNTILFPDSASAKGDFERITKMTTQE